MNMANDGQDMVKTEALRAALFSTAATGSQSELR